MQGPMGGRWTGMFGWPCVAVTIAALSACGGASYERTEGTGLGWNAGASSSGGGTAPRPPRPGGSAADAGTPPALCEGIPRTPATLYESADDSNSMLSPVIARKRARAGAFIPPSLIRPYEFLNYYGVHYTGDANVLAGVSLIPQLRPSMESADGYDLTVGIQAQPWTTRRPLNLTFVLDTSGSMQGTPLELLVEATRTAAGQLAAGDIVSMVTWSTDQNVPLDRHVVTGPNDNAVLDAINGLSANGGTNLEAGLQRGYQLAQANYSKGRLNRVVLITDGQANVGVTSAELIAQHSHNADGEGIYLVGILVGDSVNVALIDTVTDMGRGASIYLPDTDEAHTMMGPRFQQVMEVAARGVRLEVTLPWYFAVSRFHGEEISVDPREVEPQHLAPGQTMVFAQVINSCDPAAVVDTDPFHFKATWERPGSLAPLELNAEATLADLLAAGAAQLARTRAIVAYAETLQAFWPGEEAVLALRRQRALDYVALADPQGTDPALQEIRTTLQGL